MDVAELEAEVERELDEEARTKKKAELKAKAYERRNRPPWHKRHPRVMSLLKVIANVAVILAGCGLTILGCVMFFGGLSIGSVIWPVAGFILTCVSIGATCWYVTNLTSF
jgi:fatty acid desaturase